jgi:hypothetical protein
MGRCAQLHLTSHWPEHSSWSECITFDFHIDTPVIKNFRIASLQRYGILAQSTARLGELFLIEPNPSNCLSTVRQEINLLACSLPRSLNGFLFGLAAINSLLQYHATPSVIPFVNASIMSGWNNVLNPHPVKTPPANTFGPANEIFPQQYAGLDPGYLAVNSAEKFQASMFAGAFEPRMPEIIWSSSDVQSVGEQSTVPDILAHVNTSSAPEYHAPTAIVAGQLDIGLCGGDCGGQENASKPDLLAASKQFYPGVDQHKYLGYRVPNTGHMVHFHDSAAETIMVVHDWLVKMGL